MSDSRSRAIASELAKSAVVAQVTAPTPERRVGEERLSAEWVRVISEDGAVLRYWLAEGGTKLRSEVVESEAAKFLALDLLDERAAVARLTAEVERLTKDYHELIYAVGNRYRDETRHQTALRYIQQAEGRDSAAGQVTDSLPTPAPEATE